MVAPFDPQPPRGDKEHRHMVEEIAVTPFFKRHGGHMPATVKLRAEVTETSDEVTLKADIAGYGKEDVEVSATPNSFEVSLVLEKNPEGDVKFHNSYYTPSPIYEGTIRVEHRDGCLLYTSPSPRDS